jgi:hypothetical protein
MFTVVCLVWDLSCHLPSDIYPAHFLEKLSHISATFIHGTCFDQATVLDYLPNLYSRKELIVVYMQTACKIPYNRLLVSWLVGWLVGQSVSCLIS